MDALGDIGKAIVGAVLLVVAYQVLGTLLIKIPGHFVYSLFVAREKDPDNFVDIDPSDRMSIVVGLCLWAIIIAIGYAVYTVAK